MLISTPVRRIISSRTRLLCVSYNGDRVASIIQQLIPALKRIAIPLAQACLLESPTPGCFIVGGGTKERWGIISSELSPGSPCSLSLLLGHLLTVWLPEILKVDLSGNTTRATGPALVLNSPHAVIHSKP